MKHFARSGIAPRAGCASGPKLNGLPVTHSHARTLSLVDARGQHLEWIDDLTARALLKSHRAESLFSKHGRLKALRALDYQDLISSGSAPKHMSYSHNRETDRNPRGCWTFSRRAR